MPARSGLLRVLEHDPDTPHAWLQGINAIIFYAPVLFEQIAGGTTGSLLSTVVVDVGQSLLTCCPEHPGVLGWRLL